mmetsp:Transcript_9757/g.13785  ORF Transcript_9757/g.13785 Transcript_9757/m.13785 type:complete len:434 (+) Transcript_9757:52-1353(+)
MEHSFVETGTTSQNENHKEDDYLTPLYLSCLAGASTCIGASIVFFQPTVLKRDEHTGNVTKGKVVPPGTMSFSLALAASVMVTVSVVSILPKCIRDPSLDEDAPFQFIPILSPEILFRLISVITGAASYVYLGNKFAPPDPEDIITESLVSNDCEMTSPKHDGSHDLAEGDKSFDEISTDQNTKKFSSEHVLTVHEEEKVRMRLLSSSPQTTRNEMKGADNDNDNGKLKICAVSTFTNKVATLLSSATGSDLETKDQRRAWRVTILLFYSLLFHNFPEGLAVAASALESQKLGITVTVGIMIHNIPEGIAIAIPCLAARPNNPWLGFFLASASGLAEPLGAALALGFLFMMNGARNDEGNTDATNPFIYRLKIALFNLENVLAFVAGIMVAVALKELFPEARRHMIGENGKAYFWYGTISGALIMLFTEIYLP